MITAKEMKELEEKSHLTRQQLMENAGKAVYDTIKERMELKDKKVLFVCYHGNNAGDGFVAARHLCEDCETDLLFIGDESRMKKETLLNYKKAESNPRIQIISDELCDFNSYDVIVDAILGIGFAGRINREISAIIDDMNHSSAFRISIDVPTGIGPDTGETLDKCVNADLIITFHDIKKGLIHLKDKTVIADIGL